MTKKHDAKKLRGLSPPDQELAAKLTSYYSYRCGNARRKAKAFLAIFLTFGILFLLMAISSFESGNLFWVYLVFSVTGFTASIVFWKDSKNEAAIISAVRTKQYLVLEGTVADIRPSGEEGYIAEVRFYSCYGQLYEDWHRVRYEGVSMGSPLILVFIPYGQKHDAKEKVQLLTPFMMTKEGMRKALGYAPDYLPL